MSDFEQRIDQVRNDREHGSRWLVHETISILHDIASQANISAGERLRQLQQAGSELAHARPAMAALAGATGRILSAPDGVEGMAREAERLLKEYDTAIEHITEHARPFLHGTLMTGSISGTVLDVLVSCREQIERVIVLEGRPRYEGREMAKALSGHAMAVTLITDAQADIFLPQCQAVVVGADSVLANGDVLNKAGTALLGWAAQGHRLPFYVLCETLKISPHGWSGDLAQLEEKEPSEVLDQSIPGVTVRNFYFDRTPAHLITAVISEQGILSGEKIEQIVSSFKGIV
ncbi:MAG TPA: translation initiation factor eIF-2B [Ktedonobacteraceae bacterium]|jgi:ribose 1,5-bisphosphate isomerase|nr:translation initiation factor eIF-2B [Ktedonobacteraceae bacterium]